MKKIKLPKVAKRGDLTFEEVSSLRRTRREFGEKAIPLRNLSQLLWAAQGITDPGKVKRTTPSAGATYPFQVFASVKDCEELSDGFYRYIPQTHHLELLREGNLTERIKEACFNQSFLESVKVNLFLVAEYEKTTDAYGDRGVMYVHIEAGHIAQNVLLQSESLGLGAVPVGAFDNEKIKEFLNLENETVYILSIGQIK